MWLFVFCLVFFLFCFACQWIFRWLIHLRRNFALFFFCIPIQPNKQKLSLNTAKFNENLNTCIIFELLGIWFDFYDNGASVMALYRSCLESSIAKSQPHIIENEMHSQLNSLYTVKCMPFNSLSIWSLLTIHSDRIARNAFNNFYSIWN